jgi:hypothetical protein
MPVEAKDQNINELLVELEKMQINFKLNWVQLIFFLKENTFQIEIKQEKPLRCDVFCCFYIFDIWVVLMF